MDTVRREIGIHQCDIGLDSGALLLSRLKLTIGPRRLWVTAAVLERRLHDVLLGRECEDLIEFLEQALIKTETRDQATVTMQQARAEEIEDGRDASEDDACDLLVESLDLTA